MINISPSTLSVIAAALSGERAFANATHSRIEEALQSLLPGNTSTGSIDLQPGEMYLIADTDLEDQPEHFTSRSCLVDHITTRQEEMEDEGRSPRDFDDRYTVYIVRKEVKTTTERRVVIDLK